MQEQLRLGQFIENSSQPVIVLDQNGVVIFTNRKCMELLGYDQEEITRKRWVDLCKNPVSCQEAFYQLVREPDLPGSAGVHHQNEIVTKGGIC
jgi:PAS domain S-box-containing protein